MKDSKVYLIRILRIVSLIVIFSGIIYLGSFSSLVDEADNINTSNSNNKNESIVKPVSNPNYELEDDPDNTDDSAQPAVSPTPTVTPEESQKEQETEDPTDKQQDGDDKEDSDRETENDKEDEGTPELKDKEPQHKYEPSEDQVVFNNMVWGGKERTAYLTFDDGPTPKLTSQVLDILSEEDIKATFFVIGQSAEAYPYLIERIYEEGHGIANHTYSHRFDYIYKNRTNYIYDLRKAEKVLKSILGEEKEFKVTRFPGGSFGDKLAPYRTLVNERGYTFVDWNCVNGDAETVKPRTKEELIDRFKSTVKGQTNLIVLMHDAPGKATTVEALPEIIEYLKKQGYRFELIPWTR